MQHIKGENERLKQLVADLVQRHRTAAPEAVGSTSSDQEQLRHLWLLLAARVTVQI